MKVRYPRDPARDARLTESFHQLLTRLTPPPRPVDGVRIPRSLRQGDLPQWAGWPRVQVDVRLLK